MALGRDAPLESTIVRYPDASDRVTVHPVGLEGTELMSTWLTADADAFVPLESIR